MSPRKAPQQSFAEAGEAHQQHEENGRQQECAGQPVERSQRHHYDIVRLGREQGSEALRLGLPVVTSVATAKSATCEQRRNEILPQQIQSEERKRPLRGMAAKRPKASSNRPTTTIAAEMTKSRIFRM
jgi:hypothetical protein